MSREGALLLRWIISIQGSPRSAPSPRTSGCALIPGQKFLYQTKEALQGYWGSPEIWIPPGNRLN